MGVDPGWPCVHRRAFLEQISDGVQTDTLHSELYYIAQVLNADGKNYHAWSHRQWVLRALDDDAVWQREVDEYTTQLIIDSTCSSDDDNDNRDTSNATNSVNSDIRNNSAWNGRWFALHRGGGGGGNGNSSNYCVVVLSNDVAQAQVRYALKVARLDVHNPSPWRFLLAIVKEHYHAQHQQNSAQQQQQHYYYGSTEAIQQLIQEMEGMHKDFLKTATSTTTAAAAAADQTEDAADSMIDTHTTTTNNNTNNHTDDSSSPNHHHPSAALLATLVDLYVLLLVAAGNSNSTNHNNKNAAAALEHIATLQECDPVRLKYWNFRKTQITTNAI